MLVYTNKKNIWPRCVHVTNSSRNTVILSITKEHESLWFAQNRTKKNASFHAFCFYFRNLIITYPNKWFALAETWIQMKKLKPNESTLPIKEDVLFLRWFVRIWGLNFLRNCILIYRTTPTLKQCLYINALCNDKIL